MSKNILLGFKLLDKEEIPWQRGGFKSFTPGSGFGKTYMLQLYLFRWWVYVGPPTNGCTRLFKFDISIEV